MEDEVRGTVTLVLLGRHGWLFVVGDDEVEQAVARAFGDEHFAAAAAGHGGGEVSQIEAGFHLVGVVAAEAGVLKDGLDVIFVGDLFRGRGQGGNTNQQPNGRRRPA